MAVEGDVAWDAQTHGLSNTIDGEIADGGSREADFAGAMADTRRCRSGRRWRSADEPPSLTPSFVGSQVGRYTVVRHLASGGMAELYIARQEAMGGFEKPVVLKVLQPRYAENPRVVTMFLDEARLAAKLNHPSIVHVYDVADEGGHEVHRDGVHPRRDGRPTSSSAGWRSNNYLPLEHAVHIVRQTAAGLAYAHERREPDGHVLRIVHRDVSPTNILVSYEGQTKIVDFGIARAQDELREESGIAPGQGVVHVARAGARRAGRLPLGHLLAGHHPVRADAVPAPLPRARPRSMMRKIVDEKVTPPTAITRDYPPTLELIVMRALEKRPEDRYQSAEEMRHDLEEFLEESGLRSGNRRMALYMQELFAPDAADVGRRRRDVARVRRSAAARRRRRRRRRATTNSEELDLDRRAPLAMRIEVAPEPARRGSQQLGRSRDR